MTGIVVGVGAAVAGSGERDGAVRKGYLEVDRNGLEVLDREECLQLLGTVTLGRVGITFGALPVILPVNFRVVDERILFRTPSGTKLDAATCEAIVAFEVDHVEPLSNTGWSVLVTGIAGSVDDPGQPLHLSDAALPRWALSGPGRIVAVSIDMVSGRRIRPGRIGPGG